MVCGSYLCRFKQIVIMRFANRRLFAFMSAAFTRIHNSCNELAAEILAVAVSVECRLAPEHRLPA
ncbi:hypothetical protein RJ639_023081 [Escallonia herrerae]|uniref:Alpha/beta hydrolase fold-3 domain-containing protein n=1 Tax=Escallonia herrerae TaxID=1293975 RepID=A0AA88V0E5_9ASTE|nr:hypothetical protein RJ639_023081 [Escallonia herrerae]